MNTSIWGKAKTDCATESDYEARYSIFKTMGMLKSMLDRLALAQEHCIDAIREAEKKEDDFSCRTAKKRLRVCMINMKLAKEMYEELEVSLGLEQMDRMLESYTSCIDALKKRQSLLPDLQSVGKKWLARRNEMAESIDGYAELYKKLLMGKEGACGEKLISNDELERIIGEAVTDARAAVEEEAVIDEKIRMIKNRMEG